MTGVK